MLTLLAFLAPDGFPWQLLASHADQLPDTLAAVAGDEGTLAEMIGALRRYSLVKVTGDGLSAHRLLQAVIREDLDRGAQQQWAAAAIDLLGASFPAESGDVRTWPECQRLLSHVLAATGHAEQRSTRSNLLAAGPRRGLPARPRPAHPSRGSTPAGRSHQRGHPWPRSPHRRRQT